MRYGTRKPIPDIKLLVRALRNGSIAERLQGSRKVIAGGELCVSRPELTYNNNMSNKNSNLQAKKVKIIYEIIFIVLIVIHLFVRGGYGVGLAVLGIFAILFRAYITIWAANKFGITFFWSTLLGIIAALPLPFCLVPPIIILRRKPIVEITAKNKNIG